jgi:hypothetical protein
VRRGVVEEPSLPSLTGPQCKARFRGSSTRNGFPVDLVAAEVAVSRPALSKGGRKAGAATNCLRNVLNESDRASEMSNAGCPATVCRETGLESALTTLVGSVKLWA